MTDTLIEQPRPRRKSISEAARGTISGKLRNLYPVFGPKLFSPLKIDIHLDIMRAHPQFCDEFALGIVMRHHTSKPGYLVKMIAGAQRLDLNGEAAGIVTDAAAAFAAKRLAKIRRNNQSALKAVTPAKSPSQKSVGGYPDVPIKSQSQQCAEITALVGGAGNGAAATPRRQAPLVVFKRSRALSAKRA